MEIKQLAVHFTENAAEEVTTLVKEMHLVPIAKYIQQTDQPLPDELKNSLIMLLETISDLFSVELPGIDSDPESALRTISRDINLARILRERGLFRLYRLINSKNKDRVPLFMTMENPTTGSPFSRQEEFIGWFCSEAHVTRSMVFMRMATIDRLLELNFDLEKAFQIVVSKPSVIRDTLLMVADWEKGGEIRTVNPDVVMRLAEKLTPENLLQLAPVAEAARNDPSDQDAQEELNEAAKPVLAALMNEVADHERSKDAMDWVKFDLLMKSEINYKWDDETDSLMIELVRRSVDPKTGEEFMEYPVTVPFVPDVTELPSEIKADLLKRLPIKNRSML
jgi:hypothetical protein